MYFSTKYSSLPLKKYLTKNVIMCYNISQNVVIICLANRSKNYADNSNAPCYYLLVL